MNVALNVKFYFRIPDGIQVNPEKLFIDVPIDSVNLYEWKEGNRGEPIPSISAKLLEYDTVEGYSI